MLENSQTIYSDKEHEEAWGEHDFLDADEERFNFYEGCCDE